MNRSRIVRISSALFLALAFLSGCSSTNDYRKVAGVCSYTDDEIAAIRDKAEDGDANSQYELGEIYFAGTCVRLNNSAGMEWMRKSAEQGDARAQSILGWGYSMGAYGVTYNAELAKKWTLKAAEQGDIRSQKQLAYAYLAGRWGLDKDMKKSVYWYQKAAHQGDTVAQNWLGRVYATGAYGLDKNSDLALYWFQKSAHQGNIFAQKWLGKSYAEGTHGFDKNGDMALYWYQKAADQGDEEAEQSLEILECELYGEECKQMAEARAAEKERLAQEKVLAEYLRIKSDAQLGNAAAQYSMGVFHAIGRESDDNQPSERVTETTTDKLEGFWYGRVGLNSHYKIQINKSGATNYTGRVLLHSHPSGSKDCGDTTVDLTPVSKYQYSIRFTGHEKCSGEGVLVHGDDLRGDIEFHGGDLWVNFRKLGASISTINWSQDQVPFLERDIVKAGDWFQKSADQNHAPAQFALGLMYQEGVGGFTVDLAEAKSLYQKAADQGNAHAKKQLCVIEDGCDPFRKATKSDLTAGEVIDAAIFSVFFTACTIYVSGLFFLCIGL